MRVFLWRTLENLWEHTEMMSKLGVVGVTLPQLSELLLLVSTVARTVRPNWDQFSNWSLSQWTCLFRCWKVLKLPTLVAWAILNRMRQKHNRRVKAFQISTPGTRMNRLSSFLLVNSPSFCWSSPIFILSSLHFWQWNSHVSCLLPFLSPPKMLRAFLLALAQSGLASNVGEVHCLNVWAA